MPLSWIAKSKQADDRFEIRDTRKRLRAKDKDEKNKSKKKDYSPQRKRRSRRRAKIGAAYAEKRQRLEV
jgi:hypothetical protein